MDKRISGTTKTLALIGSPVGHSGSPAMYNYCFERLGIDNVYVAFDVNLDTLDTAMKGIKAMNFKGINITMPCKSAVLQYFDEVSPAAKLMGACNVAVNEDGKWIGHNTDGMGFVENLKNHGIEVEGKKLVILGAGGAGTAIQVQCALSGAKEISVFNIKDPFFEKAQARAAEIEKHAEGCHVSVYDLLDETCLHDKIEACDILVNSTRVGMHPEEDKSPITDTSVFRRGLVVCDTVYNPAVTRLLREAAHAGCTVVGGKGMLLYQGVAAFKLFTGEDMPVEEVRERFFC